MHASARVIAIFAALAASGAIARAQVRVVEQAPVPAVSAPQAPEADHDAEILQQARRLLADGKGSAAQKLLDNWIKSVEETESMSAHPRLAEGYYLRGNAKLLQDDEYDALRDYERVVSDHPGSEFFASALERELDVARLYLNGRRKPTIFGRIDSGVPVAEEIIIRVAERLPGSRLAERALLELADYYARVRDLKMAAETYDVFIKLFPRSDRRADAMERRIYATIAQFKGPQYAASVLKDAAIQVSNFQAEFPAQAQKSGITDALAARLDESAAASLLSVARWYLDRDDPVSARTTLTRLVRRHPRTASAQQAVRMVEALDSGGGAPRALRISDQPQPAEAKQ